MKETSTSEKRHDLPDFNLKEISKLDFGKLEGEHDELLEKSFAVTSAIRKFIDKDFNYILSPKGGGKSALFNVFNRQLLSNQVDYKRLSLISINQAFGFDSSYLSTTNFKGKESSSISIGWALFILNKIIQKIIAEDKNLEGYDTLISKLSKVEEFKNEFKLYNILDHFKRLKVGISFNISGTEVEAIPKISIDQIKEQLNLNTVFEQINAFYKQNKRELVISIDRLDNFVRKETYDLQKNYLQGLIDAIEEIQQNSNIQPILFLRSDLYYSSEIDIEYDKAKERTLELKWEQSETLLFLSFRFLANSYINENFASYLQECVSNEVKQPNIKYKKIKKPWYSFLLFWVKFESQRRIDLKKNISYNVAEKFIKLFMPHEVLVGNEKMDFLEWLFTNLSDANGFVNPRLLIRFLNLLSEEQSKFYKLNEVVKQTVSPVLNNGFPHYPLFTREVLLEVYSQLQNEELRNVHKILKSREYQAVFKMINEKTANKNMFKSGDISLKQVDMDREDLKRMLKYVELIGYCKEIEKGVYHVPPLFGRKLELVYS